MFSRFTFFVVATVFVFSFLAKADSAHADFEKKMKIELQEVQDKISDLSKKTKSESKEELAKLEEKRKKLSGDLKSLQTASGKAWEDLRTGFEKAFKELKASVKQAGERF